MNAVYKSLDIFFVTFHTLLIVFNLTGWIWAKTRKVHRVAVSLTLFSWVVLGYFYGWGYCFLTEWHYDILRKLGETALPHSYITYLLENYFGLEARDHLVELGTAITFFVLVLLTYGLWFYEIKKKRAS